MFSSQSKWISCNKSLSAPIIVKNIFVKDLSSAKIDISGLGYYELFINGRRVSNEYFKPAVSDYAERDFSNYLYPLSDKTSHTIYYNTYDISKYFIKGENSIAIMLGNGFYRQTKRLAEGETKFGDELLLRFEIKLVEDNNVCVISSDGTELAFAGFIEENNLFFGEIHDYANFDFDVFTGNVKGIVEKTYVVNAPKAKILKQKCPNDVVRARIIPKVVKRTGDRVIYDVGKNITGFVSLRAKSSVVKVRHSEEIIGDELDFCSCGGETQISENVYKNAQGKIVHPWFSWSGFRYFEVVGEVDEIEVLYICSNIAVTAEFRCGNDNINWLFDSYVNTQISNMHGGIPSDCPHRERLGYTGDGQVTAECAMLLLDARKFYEKWIRDIADCQDKKTGHIQHTAPFFGGGGGPGGWGCAIVIVPYAYYKIYGDVRILKKYYSNMLEYIRCMKEFSDNGLITKERDKGWCLGDWCTPEKNLLPEPFINSFYYVRSMQIIEEIAKIIGEEIDYDADIDFVKNAIQKAYFNSETVEYCGGKQGANVFALLLGLGDERTEDSIIRQYTINPSFDTGIFGTDILTEYLSKIGEVQLLFNLLKSEVFASFGYMKKHGATTLWENWDGRDSHNHPMFGGCVKQLFYGLLGIVASAGFRHISIKPKYIEGINYIKAKLKFSHGEIAFDYTYCNGKVIPCVKTKGKICVDINY